MADICPDPCMELNHCTWQESSERTLKLSGSPMKRHRRDKLEKVAGYNDKDLFNGRFVPRREKTPTSSTRGSTAREDLNDAVEDTIRKGLAKQLTTFFANQNDAKLLVKLLVADGIVPWFRLWVMLNYLMVKLLLRVTVDWVLLLKCCWIVIPLNYYWPRIRWTRFMMLFKKVGNQMRAVLAPKPWKSFRWCLGLVASLQNGWLSTLARSPPSEISLNEKGLATLRHETCWRFPSCQGKKDSLFVSCFACRRATGQWWQRLNQMPSPLTTKGLSKKIRRMRPNPTQARLLSQRMESCRTWQSH